MRINKVVYILGAGFSRPLGIPIMDEFLDKARNLIEEDAVKFSDLKVVLDNLSRFERANSRYVSLNVRNLEQVLSYLEVEALFSNEGNPLLTRAQFRKFLAKVIDESTPRWEQKGRDAKALMSDILTYREPAIISLDDYARFFFALMNLCSINKESIVELTEKSSDKFQPKTQYSIITLNYDLVPFEAVSAIFRQSELYRHGGAKFGLRSDNTQISPNERFNVIPLSFLHGTVDKPESIVPPTWTKYLEEEYRNPWKIAFEELRAAHYIRFIGYSLPEGDSNMRYLMATALGVAANVQSIDVICLDNQQKDVKKRYEEFFHKRLNFRSMRVEEYFSFLQPKDSNIIRTNNRTETIHFFDMEECHRNAMKS
jgi:hypothetical protein